MAKQLNLQSLLSRIEQQDETIAWMRQVLATQQIDGPWVSPDVAATLLCVSRHRVMNEIQSAEVQRANRQSGDLAYGQHYRNVQDPIASRPTWQVNFVEFKKILDIPPDRRKFS